MIGLFLGETDFPKLIIKKLKKKKIKYLILDLTKKKIFKNDPNSYHISIGQFGKILNLLNYKKCKKVIFAGKIDKPQISKLKLDFKGIYYIARIIKAAKKGDAAILKELIKTGTYDHVQAVIVRKNVITKETRSGTRKLIKSIRKNRSQNGVLIKFPKTKQDLRVDLPTIGINTFKDLKSKNLKGIVVKGNQNIILDRKDCFKFIDKNKMFLIAK